MSFFVSQYAPNPVNALYSASESGAWKILATDGSTYDTLAALVAAGKTPYPGLEPGPGLQFVTLRSDNGSGAAGSAFYYQTNTTVAPTNFDAAVWVAGGAVEARPGPVRLLWLYKGANGDRIWIEGGY